MQHTIRVIKLVWTFILIFGNELLFDGMYLSVIMHALVKYMRKRQLNMWVLCTVHTECAYVWALCIWGTINENVRQIWPWHSPCGSFFFSNKKLFWNFVSCPASPVRCILTNECQLTFCLTAFYATNRLTFIVNLSMAHADSVCRFISFHFVDLTIHFAVIPCALFVQRWPLNNNNFRGWWNAALFSSHKWIFSGRKLQKSNYCRRQFCNAFSQIRHTKCLVEYTFELDSAMQNILLFYSV